MAKRSPKLIFTEEERKSDVLGKSIQKADKAEQKLRKAESNVPKKRIKKGLSFEEVEKKKPTSGKKDAVKRAPAEETVGALSSHLRENEDDSASADAVHGAENATRTTARTGRFIQKESKLKPYRDVEKAEKEADKANLNALNKKASVQNSETVSNPYSKWRQKQNIKKEYAAAKKSGKGTKNASEVTKKAGEKAAAAGEKVTEFIAEHPKVFLIIGLIVGAILLFSMLFSSCSVMFNGVAGTITGTSYPSTDEAMLGAESAYCELERQLFDTISNYERTHDYDEYVYELDAIEHDPYVLISALTAMKGGEWTLSGVRGDLNTLFSRQYTLTQSVETEHRTRTVTNDDGTTGTETYTYTICTVKLKNNNLSHIPSEIMSENQLVMYATYMHTLGNRPDLFANSVYVSKYITDEYERYSIPPEAMQDETFAKMIKEAEKYLGYPYVWGGASPQTSFDCSGFVSWVVNHSGWNFGRLTAQGLLNKCTRVSPANARPGDLIFFEKTYDTVGASHVGIYVGNGMMIHCGDPIQYASVNSNYFRSHFLCYGRLP